MLLYIKVKPNHRFNKIERSENDWLIKLKAPATEGKANKNLIEFLSEVLQLPKSKIVLLKGETSRIKCLEINAEETFVLAALAKWQSENE
jgi:uncharacterized protein (TIGR00251 family)